MAETFSVPRAKTSAPLNQRNLRNNEPPIGAEQGSGDGHE